MKLRIQGDSLRLRLTRSEVARLHEKGAVEETMHFADGRALTYQIQRLACADAIHAGLKEGTITVHVPAGSVAAWATSDEVGLATRDGALRIVIEKDFRCLTRSRDEDEVDAYPHPAEQVNY